MSQEKRKHPRFPLIEMITVVAEDGKSFIAKSENLSLGGVFLITENPLTPGTEGVLRLMIDTGKVKKEISSKFRVVHNNSPQKWLSGMGVEFFDLSDEVKEIIQELK